MTPFNVIVAVQCNLFLIGLIKCPYFIMLLSAMKQMGKYSPRSSLLGFHFSRKCLAPSDISELYVIFKGPLIKRPWILQDKTSYNKTLSATKSWGHYFSCCFTVASTRVSYPVAEAVAFTTITSSWLTKAWILSPFSGVGATNFGKYTPSSQEAIGESTRRTRFLLLPMPSSKTF